MLENSIRHLAHQRALRVRVPTERELLSAPNTQATEVLGELHNDKLCSGCLG